MSDLRVALVAEGPTDATVIEAALKALLPRPFVLAQLQCTQAERFSTEVAAVAL